MARLVLLERVTSDEESVYGRQIRMKDREKWMELCRQASVEQNPKRMLELTAEIIRLLDEKEDRLVHRAAKPEGDPTPRP
jgi:hypothetical protein